jgi:hypothetical protein
LTLGLVIGCQSTDTPPVASRYSQVPVKSGDSCVACNGSPYFKASYPTVPVVTSQSVYHWDPATGTSTVASKLPVDATQTAVAADPSKTFVQISAVDSNPAVSQAVAVDPFDKVNFPRGQPEVNRKSFADITAHASFSHAPDYHWISGEAMLFRKEWRLRYSSVDEADQYGGSLRLVGDALLKDLKDGAQYKLEGRLTPDDGKGPFFMVENVEIVK